MQFQTDGTPYMLVDPTTGDHEIAVEARESRSRWQLHLRTLSGRQPSKFQVPSGDNATNVINRSDGSYATETPDAEQRVQNAGQVAWNA